MMLTSVLFCTLSAALPSVAAPPGWQKILESTAPKEWISSVLAFGPNDWFVGGVGWVARGTGAGIGRTAIGSRAVLGLFGRAPENVFALGDDELILHFDGKTWREEHVGPQPKRPGRGADILHSLYSASAKLVAFGPTLLLVRSAGGAWSEPSQRESQTLLELAESGPPGFKAPAKCEMAGWFWLGEDKAMFDCHDGRSFTYDGGRVMPDGILPRECRRALDSISEGQGRLFAGCGPGMLWVTGHSKWRPFASFRGVKELVSISVTDTCVFVASRRAVWRSCGP